MCLLARGARRARSSFGFVPIGLSYPPTNDTRGRRLHLRRDRTQVLALLPVVPMTLISALLMVIVSRCTLASRLAGVTLARYF
jgi:hypothetical protein